MFWFHFGVNEIVLSNVVRHFMYANCLRLRQVQYTRVLGGVSY